MIEDVSTAIEIANTVYINTVRIMDNSSYEFILIRFFIILQCMIQIGTPTINRDIPRGTELELF